MNTPAKTAYILVAGRLTLPARLNWLPAPDYVVAADGGAKHAAALGLHVDAWVGDFDSAAGNEIAAPRETHPTAKDETDGELATRMALRAGCTRLVFVGAFGGRFDHAAALLLGGLRLAEAGFEVWLTSGDEHARPLVANPSIGTGLAASAGLSLSLPAQTTLSVVAVSDLRGLSLSGVRWPLRGADVPLGSGWTLSNVVGAAEQVPVHGSPQRSSLQQGGTQQVVQASLRAGRALVTWLEQGAGGTAT